MWNNTKITNIKNNYVLKSLFCYFDYQYILKLIRNNKNLQSRLGITLDNYKNKSDSLKYAYIKNTRISKHYINNRKMPEKVKQVFLQIMIAGLQLMFLIPFFIYSILLVTTDTFNEKNTKDNYNKKIYNIIKIINRYLFIYDAFIIGSCLLCVFYICDDYRHDYGKKKIFKIILQILINLVNISFECLVIWKLILSYQIKKSGCTWFMVLDYLFIIINFIYISGFFYFLYEYFKNAGDLVTIYTKYILTLFNNIKIKEYNLPKNFETFPKNERKKYVLNNYKNFNIIISSEQKALINAINEYRTDNDLPLLGICECRKIPEFLIKEPTEMMLFADQRIFKLSNKKYLFKNPVGDFNINFNRNDRNILNILLKDNLNHIQIITYKNMEYVYIYTLDFCKYHTTEFNTNSSSNRSILKLNSDRYDSYSDYDYDYKKNIFYE